MSNFCPRFVPFCTIFCHCFCLKTLSCPNRNFFVVWCSMGTLWPSLPNNSQYRHLLHFQHRPLIGQREKSRWLYGSAWAICTVHKRERIPDDPGGHYYPSNLPDDDWRENTFPLWRQLSKASKLCKISSRRGQMPRGTNVKSNVRLANESEA